jgi:fructokinase
VAPLEPAPHWQLGIDLGGTKIQAELFAPDGAHRWGRRMATPAGDYAATLQALHTLVNEARLASGQSNPACVRVGLGGPGALMADGRIRNANSTCLNGQPLLHDLAQMIGQPLRYANDANCLALSEARDGAAAGEPMVFAVILGTGTGAGLAIHGQVWEGPNRLAGEWGHNPLPWPDADESTWASAEPCWCGQRGCVEGFLSGPAIARDHQRRHGLALTAEAITQRAQAGDAACTATLARHANRLARALAAVVNTLDPTCIVLAGGVSLRPGLVDEVQAHWHRWLFGHRPGEPVATRLVLARHGDASGVRGAARLWQEPVRGGDQQR